MYSEQAQACTLGSYTKPGTSLYTQVYQELPAWKLWNSIPTYTRSISQQSLQLQAAC